MEYIVIDGKSNDGTTQIIEKYTDRLAYFISEQDQGMYDAMNKGLAKATGDVIGILNADDFYPNSSVLSQIAAIFESSKIDCLYGDIQFVAKNDITKIVRHYSSKTFKPWKFRFGYMPAHLSFFAKRSAYEKFGFFKTNYRLCADFDLVARFLAVHKLSSVYVPLVVVHMRMGGRSNQSIKAILQLNKEILRGCLENGIYSNLFFIYLKYFTKVFELIPFRSIR